jgi:hypothetical protein
MKSSDMYCEALKNNVKYYKETEKGQNIMCQIIEDYVENVRINTTLEAVKNLMESMKLTSEQAMVALKITEDDRVEILKRM